MKKSDVIRGGKRQWLIGALAGKLVALYSKTLKFDFINKENNVTPAIYVFWHNRILAVPAGYRKVDRSGQLACLTSASTDGAMIEHFMAQYNIQSIRGSSSRRGRRAMVEMIRTLKSGVSLAITPDGPRGPKYKLNAGALKLSSKTGVGLVPIQVFYSDYFELNTWDKFRIPKPFSTVTIVYNKPVYVSDNLSEDEEEELRLSIEETLISPLK